MEPLVDGWGRRIASLRISVTDKCNFRCTYCMPAEGLEWLCRDEILSFEEIERLTRIFASLGIEEVRLTGGEPLVRRDLPVLVGMLARIGVDDLSLTTNGVLLDRFAKPQRSNFRAELTYTGGIDEMHERQRASIDDRDFGAVDVDVDVGHSARHDGRQKMLHRPD